MQPRQGIFRTIWATLALTLVLVLSGARAQAGFVFFSDPSAFNA
jgi:hypothetical protein